jgi:hypothetical protein
MMSGGGGGHGYFWFFGYLFHDFETFGGGVGGGVALLKFTSTE